jgi:transposase
VTAILTDPDAAVPGVLRQAIALVVDEVHGLEDKIAGLDRQLKQIAGAHPVATRLPTILGSVGHIHAFRRGREFASWLGLTPRESSTGARRYLGRISKRGDVHLRCLLAHGARAVLRIAETGSSSA